MIVTAMVAFSMVGCGKIPILSSILPAKAEETPAIASPYHLKIDSGEGAILPDNSRAVLSTWHAGYERDQQALCHEPPVALGKRGWARYELCLEYLNGLIDIQTYRDRLKPLQDVPE